MMCHPERESEANESRDLPRVGGAFINNDACAGWGDPSTTPLRVSAQDDGGAGANAASVKSMGIFFHHRRSPGLS